MGYTLEERYEKITQDLLSSQEKDPLRLFVDMAKKDYINMHGVEHHYLDGAIMLTVLYRAGMKFDLETLLKKLQGRSVAMPGAMCGYWGICGSLASVGAAFSLLDETTPLSSDASYGDHMEFASTCLKRMASLGGPRCCKRHAYLVLEEGCAYAEKHYGIPLPRSTFACPFSARNSQCLSSSCPYHK